MKKKILIFSILSLVGFNGFGQEKNGTEQGKNVHTYTDQEIMRLSAYIKTLEERDEQGELTYKEDDIIKLSSYIKELEKKDSLLTILQADFKNLETDRNQLKEALARSESRIKELEASYANTLAGSNSGTGAAGRPMEASAAGIVVQTGVFSTEANATNMVEKIRAIDPSIPVSVKEEVINGKKMHRVYAGNFSNSEEAGTFKKTLKRNGIDGIIHENQPAATTSYSKKDMHNRIIEVYGKAVRFDFNSADLKEGSQVVLDSMVDILKKEDAPFILEGHADITGSATWNQELSEMRANTIKNYLVNKGIPASRLNTIGYGSSRPIHSNSTKLGRAKNRAVIIKPAK